MEAVLVQPYRMASSPNTVPVRSCPTTLPFFKTSNSPSVTTINSIQSPSFCICASPPPHPYAIYLYSMHLYSTYIYVIYPYDFLLHLCISMHLYISLLRVSTPPNSTCLYSLYLCLSTLCVPTICLSMSHIHRVIIEYASFDNTGQNAIGRYNLK